MNIKFSQHCTSRVEHAKDERFLSELSGPATRAASVQVSDNVH